MADGEMDGGGGGFTGPLQLLLDKGNMFLSPLHLHILSYLSSCLTNCDLFPALVPIKPGEVSPPAIEVIGPGPGKFPRPAPGPMAREAFSWAPGPP